MEPGVAAALQENPGSDDLRIAAALSARGRLKDTDLARAALDIAREAEMEIGSVECLIDDRDGTRRFFDINALSNFVAKPMEVLGFDPHDDLVDWLMQLISERKAAA